MADEVLMAWDYRDGGRAYVSTTDIERAPHTQVPTEQDHT